MWQNGHGKKGRRWRDVRSNIATFCCDLDLKTDLRITHINFDTEHIGVPYDRATDDVDHDLFDMAGVRREVVGGAYRRVPGVVHSTYQRPKSEQVTSRRRVRSCFQLNFRCHVVKIWL